MVDLIRTFGPLLNGHIVLRRSEFFFDFILRFDSVRNDARSLQRKDLLVDSEKENDPEITEGSVRDFPDSGLGVPPVTASDCRCNLFMSQGSLHLRVTDVASARTRFLEHGLNRFFRDRELQLRDVVLQLVKRTTLIKGRVNSVAQFADTVNRNFQRLVPLLEVLWWPGVSP